VVSQGKVTDVEYDTYLTVDWASRIHEDKKKYYGNKAAPSRKGVNLLVIGCKFSPKVLVYAI
jgi:hypothetical protein